MQQMDLIDNYQLDQVDIGTLTRLPSDNVPFLGSGHDDLRLFDLLLRQMRVTRQFSDLNPVLNQSLLKVADYLGD